jgi:F-type H+-transporting ATPase subunit delta
MPEIHHTNRPQETVFDVKAERLARIYAEAGLDAAGDLSQQQAMVEELESIVSEVLQRDARLGEIFASELISAEDKIAMLDRLFGGRVSTVTLNSLKVMARNERLHLIREVARASRMMWFERSDRVPAFLETANPLDSDLEREILEAFDRVIGGDPIVTHRVNPELISGFILRVGDRVYDGSVKTRLEQMRQAMIDRAVEAIQLSGHERFITNSES